MKSNYPIKGVTSTS